MSKYALCYNPRDSKEWMPLTSEFQIIGVLNFQQINQELPSWMCLVEVIDKPPEKHDNSG